MQNICTSKQTNETYLNKQTNKLIQHIYANPLNFVFGWVPVTRDKVVKFQEPLPNHLIKQQQEKG